VLFFLTFYAALLSYKLVRKEQFITSDIALLLLNSFVFFGIGYSLLSDHHVGTQLLGAFTLANALVHFGVSVLIYRNKLADRNLFFLVAGLVLVFITIAVPVQLEGNWVTMIWIGEAALLFWIGRTRHAKIHELLSYPLMLLAFGSLMHDWQMAGSRMYWTEQPRFTPIFNITFLTALFVSGGFAFITYLLYNKRYPSPFPSTNPLQKIIGIGVPALMLVTLYYAFANEIRFYWDLHFSVSTKNVDAGTDNEYQIMNYDLIYYRTMWLLNYSMLFVLALALVNLKWLKNQLLAYVNMILIALVGLAFLTQGLTTLSMLRDSFLTQDQALYYPRTAFAIVLRYISLAAFGGLLVALYTYVKSGNLEFDLRKIFESVLAVVLLVLVTAEFFNLMDLSGYNRSYKFGLSVLWGLFALAVIGIGIWKTKKHLRIGAMGLLAITLAKLFLYDISHLDTISKTIVMISLGLLLLVVSFLYNKYKHLIADESHA
jgi:uncharacterized membrane protein